MKILMIGATGKFAKYVIPSLKKERIEIKALVRNDNRAEIAKANGADETVNGDLNDLNSLRNAIQNVDGVYYLNPVFMENEIQMGLNMVKAAEEAKIDKFVFSSVYHPSLSLENHVSKRPIEEALYESELKFVILQPAMFMQTVDNTLSVIKQTKLIGLPYSKSAKMSYVDYRDVADVVAIAFTDNKLDNGTFELSSHGMYNRIELAEIISNIIGDTVEAKEIDFDDFSKGMPDGFTKNGLRAMFKHYDHCGFHGGNSLILETILNRKPRTLQAYFEEIEKEC
jgi:uncharacterized protein YbjT (DUF2867 family)